MSPYAADNDRRFVVYSVLWMISALIAFFVTILIDSYLSGVNLIVDFMLFLLSISPFAVCLALINHLPQKCLLRISGIEDISGSYNGVLKSSFDDGTKEHSVKVIVKQSFYILEVELSTETSRSYCTSAFIKQMGTRTVLTYTYQNEGSAINGLDPHVGTCWISFGEEKIHGEYYTHPSRRTAGEIELRQSDS